MKIIRIKNIFLSLLVTIFFNIIFCSILCVSHVFATQTQVNEINDLFDRHIENKEELLQGMRRQNDNAIENIKSGAHRDVVPGIGETDAKVGELNSINERDLEASGRTKRISKEYQFYDENELEPDYTKAGNVMHQLDAKDIVGATEEKLRKIGTDLTARLKAFGFNCKTVKGSVQKEQTHYIELKQEKQQNTVYDQVFCQELRSHYDCRDKLTLRCAQRGMEWGSWQDKQIKIPARELFNFGCPIFEIHHTRGKCFEHKINIGYSGGGVWGFTGFKSCFGPTGWGGSVTNVKTLNHLRKFLVTKHQDSTIDNIGSQMSSAWEGGIFSIKGWRYRGEILGSKSYAWRTYVINYQYREGKPICTDWSESWSETCILK